MFDSQANPARFGTQHAEPWTGQEPQKQVHATLDAVAGQVLMRVVEVAAGIGPEGRVWLGTGERIIVVTVVVTAAQAAAGVHMYTYTYMYVYICVDIHMYLFIHVNTYICIYPVPDPVSYPEPSK